MLYAINPLPSSRAAIGTRRIAHLHTDGTVYAADGGDLVKSSDWGTTWSAPIWSAPYGTIGQVRKLATGEIVVTSGKRIYKSDASEANFSLVYTMEGGVVYSDFGFDAFGDLLLAAEYGENVGRVYMSRDGGDTWQKIYDNPAAYHIHDVRYDPYEGLIWIAQDGTAPQRGIVVTPDFGATWWTEREKCVTRSTQIIPLPERVLLGSDEHYEQNIRSIERVPGGTGNQFVDVVKLWAPHRQFEAGKMTWMGRAAIRYGSKPAAFFGWHQDKTNIHAPSTVYGTDDGVRFRVVWSDYQFPVPSAGTDRCGIIGVFGPDNNGNLAVHLGSSVGADHHWLVKVTIAEMKV